MTAHIAWNSTKYRLNFIVIFFRMLFFLFRWRHENMLETLNHRSTGMLMTSNYRIWSMAEADYSKQNFGIVSLENWWCWYLDAWGRNAPPRLAWLSFLVHCGMPSKVNAVKNLNSAQISDCLLYRETHTPTETHIGKQILAISKVKKLLEMKLFPFTPRQWLNPSQT